jgi:hypothetical protein
MWETTSLLADMGRAPYPIGAGRGKRDESDPAGSKGKALQPCPEGE